MSSFKLNVTGPVSLEIFSICEIALKYFVSLELFYPVAKGSGLHVNPACFFNAVLNKGNVCIYIIPSFGESNSSVIWATCPLTLGK